MLEVRKFVEEDATVADNVCFLTCLYKNAVRTLYLLYFILTVLLLLMGEGK